MKKITLHLILVLFLSSLFAETAYDSNYRFYFYTNRGTMRLVSLIPKTEELLGGVGGNYNSWFYLKIGEAIYKLQGGTGYGSVAEVGGSVHYSVAKRANVKLDFLPMTSRDDDLIDVIKMVATIENISESNEVFGLKAVFDTLLGEKNGSHFSTDEIDSINSETQFDLFRQHKYVKTSNGKNSVDFLLYGEDASVVNMVTLSAKDSLVNGQPWIPNVVRDKPFDNVITYNDSALAVNWADVALAPKETASVIFYITVATEGDEPATDISSFRFVDKNENIDLGGRQIEETDKEWATQILPSGNNAPDFDVVVSGKNVDLSYVQMLLDRINELELDGSNTNREELLKLNMELDTVMEQLGQ